MSDEQDYFARSRTWATDLRARDARLLRLAWTIAGIAVAAALLEAVALAMLAPLKTVTPVAMLVDRQTGFVQTIDPSQPMRISADAAMTQSLLAQYVNAREGFDRATVAQDYRRVALWSAGLARSQYLSLMPASNALSPLSRMSAGSSIVTRIKSVTMLSKGLALVRFDTTEQGRNGQQSQTVPWISAVRYRFSDGPMSFEDRLDNPLGFQVVTYRRDAEAPAPPLVIRAPSTASAAPASVPPGSFAHMSGYGQAQPVVELSLDQGRSHRELRDVPLNQIPLGSPLVQARPGVERPGS